MTKVAVVYHSGYGHTHEQAKAVQAGAASVPGVTAEIYRVESADQDFAPILEALSKADAIIFGAPTYMGSVPYQFKAFMDASSKVYAVQGWAGKLAAGFTNSGSFNGDKHNTLLQLFTLAAQHNMLWVPLGVPSGNNTTKGSPEDLNRLGASIGAMGQSPADAGADVGPSASDKRTAAELGKHVAEAAKRWNGAA